MLPWYGPKPRSSYLVSLCSCTARLCHQRYLRPVPLPSQIRSVAVCAASTFCAGSHHHSSFFVPRRLLSALFPLISPLNPSPRLTPSLYTTKPRASVLHLTSRSARLLEASASLLLASPVDPQPPSPCFIFCPPRPPLHLSARPPPQSVFFLLHGMSTVDTSALSGPFFIPLSAVLWSCGPLSSGRAAVLVDQELSRRWCSLGLGVRPL